MYCNEQAKEMPEMLIQMEFIEFCNRNIKHYITNNIIIKHYSIQHYTTL